MKRSKSKYIMSSTVLLTLALAASGCGNQDRNPQLVQQPPTSQLETGSIVSNTDRSTIETVIAKYPMARFRVVNQAHNIYEVMGLSQQKLQQEVPGAEVESNIFFQANAAPDLKANDLFAQMATLANRSSANPGFTECVQSADTPTAKITLSSDDEKSHRFFLLGTTIRWNATASTANSKHPGQLKKAWVIMPGETSSHQKRSVFGNSVSYMPDTTGSMSLGLIVQDQRGVCAADIFSYAVTDNKDYIKLRTKIPEPNLREFTHLKELQAKKSWKLSQGEHIVIAVIDSGVNYNHSTLNDNIYINSEEIPNNLIDDDNNGFVDDYVGYDFAFSDNLPYDDTGHGSHVSGLAASRKFGLARRAKIMPVKVLSPFGGDLASVAGGIRYAVDQGADIINLSLGSYGKPNRTLKKALEYANKKNVVVVAAAGNGDDRGIGVDNDQNPVYPASFSYDNIISVAAKGSGEKLASYSNYGVSSVDVVAPGGGIDDGGLLSAYMANPIGEAYVSMAGTSMAAPVVAGIVAQMLSLNSSLSPAEVKALLMQTGKKSPTTKDKVASGRFVNALDAVKLASELPLASN